MARHRRDDRVAEVTERIRRTMRPWGISVSFLASRLGVSRQYAWQIVHYRTALSLERASEIESIVQTIIAEKSHMKTFGQRLRAARRAAGLTLKEAAGLIGYSWVGVERWERDLCLPKPGVLWHLLSLYGVAVEGAPAYAMAGSRPPERPVGALDAGRGGRRGLPMMFLHPAADQPPVEGATAYAARALSAHRALRRR